MVLRDERGATVRQFVRSERTSHDLWPRGPALVAATTTWPGAGQANMEAQAPVSCTVQLAGDASEALIVICPQSVQLRQPPLDNTDGVLRFGKGQVSWCHEGTITSRSFGPRAFQDKDRVELQLTPTEARVPALDAPGRSVLRL